MLHYHGLMTKPSNPPFFKNLNITLLTYLLPCPAARVPVMSSWCWRTFGHLARTSTECSCETVDGELYVAAVYRPEEDILSSCQISPSQM